MTAQSLARERQIRRSGRVFRGRTGLPGREGAAEKYGYLIELLSSDNYSAAYTFLSPPETGDTVSEKVVGAHVTYPKPAMTGKPALDFLRGYLLHLMGGYYEALYVWSEIARDPDNVKKYPMLDYFSARARREVEDEPADGR